MNEIRHKTLLRQIKKSEINTNSNQMQIFLDLVSSSYKEYESQIERVNNTLDVSLKKSFELSLKIEENAKSDFKLLIDGIPGLISWFDEELNYLGVNENLLSFTKQSKNSFIGKKLGQLSNEYDSELIIAFKKFILSDDSHYKSDFTIIVNEEKFNILSHFQKLNGGKINVIASIDLTEHYKLQDVIKEQNEVALKNSKLAAIGEMAAGVAHEINNPLAVILASSKQLLNAEANQKLTSVDLKNKLEKIQRMAERINRIVKGLKYISRDGTSDPYELTQLKLVFNSALELCHDKMIKHKIDFSIIGDDTQSIYCQPVSLSQVFLNLLNNSIDAITEKREQELQKLLENNSKSEPTPTLPNLWIKIFINAGNSSIEVRFVDCGSGIPKSIQEKIFQPFFTTKAIGRGTGLGLSISKSIVEKHHGQFTIDQKSPNTCFVMVFPSINVIELLEKKAA